MKGPTRVNTISIDVETFSPTPIHTGGAYAYAADPDFELLLFAYSIDGAPVEVIDLAQGATLPDEVLAGLLDPGVEKWAFNAAFERITIGQHLHRQGITRGPYLDPAGWRCSMVWASALGLPRSLKDAAEALGLGHQKMDEGKDLIKMFCVPTQPRATTGPALFDTDTMTHRYLPSSAPEKWAQFIEYNRRDVDVENELRQHLAHQPLSAQTWAEYEVDQRINDNGIRIDLDLARAAIVADDTHREHCLDEARELTGLPNPAAPMQIKQWLADNGLDMPSLTKEAVADATKTANGSVKRVLELRQDMSRSSVKKYQAMLNATHPTDQRAHGLLQFYGAGRTGRWAGRLIQVQNLPRNELSGRDLDQARNLIHAGHHDAVELLYDSVPDTLSQLIRTAFIPADGMRFLVADYSAIEARVLAWLAGQDDTLDAFRRGDDLYCATAAAMFGVPVDKHGPNSHLRQRGKVAVLACGYQGGVNAIRAMGGERMGMTDAEMKDTVTKWRSANEKIVNFWWDVERAAKSVVRGYRHNAQAGPIGFHMNAGALIITLPSGRELVYPQARHGRNRFGDDGLIFQGLGLNRKPALEETYGGKLVENITQAVARDLLAHALSVVHAAGHRIVMHVHDEIVVEAPPSTSLEEVTTLMAQAPGWAQGLPLDADGGEFDYYQK